ncbi:hypothetical protein KC359_g118 [Hortaea werneckii]|nr:hypothetical protein KC359_g118 [Hortaea werneckii]
MTFCSALNFVQNFQLSFQASFILFAALIVNIPFSFLLEPRLVAIDHLSNECKDEQITPLRRPIIHRRVLFSTLPSRPKLQFRTLSPALVAVAEAASPHVYLKFLNAFFTTHMKSHTFGARVPFARL